MADMEKVYCDNNTPLWASMLNNNNQWSNNPWMYLIFLALFGNGAFGGYGGGNAQNELSRQVSSLQGTVNDNHNTQTIMDAMNNNQGAIRELAQTFNTDINSINMALCNVRSAIEKVGGDVGMSAQQVINSVLLGNKDLIQQMCNCCCETKQTITTMGYEGQLRDQANTASIISRIDQLANGVQQGFSQIGFETQKQTNDIIQAGNANTQRIIDTMNAHWTQDLQQRLNDAKLELSQQTQNAYLVSQLKTT